MDDYAHHPSEVAATLAAAAHLEPRRLVGASSRTSIRAREPGARLLRAVGGCVVVVVDVYPARERGGGLPRRHRARGSHGRGGCRRGPPGLVAAAMDEAERMLWGGVAGGDLLLTLGAGDVDELAARLTA